MWKFVTVLLLVAAAYAEDEATNVELEDGVLVLTADNFDHVVNNNEFVLVEFYAPWCGHCKKLTPEYAAAAQALAEEESTIKLAKVDATVHKDLGGKFGVRGYPTLKFFRDGAASDYNGGRTKDTIITWLKKKSGPPAVQVATKEDAEKLMKNEVTLIGFFKDQESDAAKAFLKVAAQNDEYQFGICSDEALFKEYNMEKEGVALFKQFDEKRADLTDDITVESVTNFIKEKSTALVTMFSQKVSQKLFGDKSVPFLFVAVKKSAAEEFEKAKEMFSGVAETVRGKLKVVFLDTESSETAQVLKYMDMSETPDYRILNLEKGLKYKPELMELVEDKVKEFVSGFVNGAVRPFLKSQDVPEDWDKENVKVLTGKNFKEVAMDDSKHVFVEFYAPWCGHCKNLAPIWDELAEKFAANDDVIIAKMDSTENELEEVSIKGFPTLKMFPANSDGKIQDYQGGRTLEELVKFVSKYSEPKQAEEKVDTPKDVADEKKKDEL